MTAKEKAKELTDKHSPYVYCYMGSGMLSNTYDEDVILNMSKKCALIAADEVLETLNSPPIRTGNESHMLWKATVDYWQEVKQEIEKL